MCAIMVITACANSRGFVTRASLISSSLHKMCNSKSVRAKVVVMRAVTIRLRSESRVKN